MLPDIERTFKMIVFTCGGTGGHISPALNIADTLKEQQISSDICFIGGDRIESLMITNHKLIVIPNLKRRPVSIIKNIFHSIKILKQLNPTFVFATGGYVTLPVGIATVLLKIPLVLLEQNSVPGRANRFLSKFATVIFTGYPIDYFKKNITIFSGNPVTKPVIRKKTKLLILGGSQGAATINSLIKDAVLDISKTNSEVIWLTGQKSFNSITAELKKYKQKENIFKINNAIFEIFPFRNDMPTVLSQVKIAISRSGAMSVSELVENNIPSLFIPYPYAMDNHQVYNAKYIVDNHGGEMILEKDINKDLLLQTLNKLNDNQNKYQLALKALPNNATSIIISCLQKKGFIKNVRK